MKVESFKGAEIKGNVEQDVRNQSLNLQIVIFNLTYQIMFSSK